MFFPKEDEQVRSKLFETKEKKLFFVERNDFAFDTIENTDRITKHVAFIGSNRVKVLLARGEDFIIFYTKNMCPTTKKRIKQKTHKTIYVKKTGN